MEGDEGSTATVREIAKRLVVGLIRFALVVECNESLRKWDLSDYCLHLESMSEPQEEKSVL